MRLTKRVKRLLFLLFSIAVLFIGYNFSSKNQATTTTTSVTATSSVASTAAIQKPLDLKEIYFLQQSDKGKKIYRYDSQSKKQTLFFTDSDEKQKINAVLGLSDEGKVIVLLDGDGSKSLAEISNDGKGTIKILNADYQFQSVSRLGFNHVLTVSFSNAERDFGFKLITADLAGANLREISRQNLPFVDYQWGKTEKIIYYGKNTSSGVSEIDKVDLEKSETSLLTKINQQIQLFVFDDSNNKVYFLAGKKIYQKNISQKDSEAEMLYNANSDINSLRYLNNALYFSQNHQIKKFNLETKQISDIIGGEQIISVK